MGGPSIEKVTLWEALLCLRLGSKFNGGLRRTNSLPELVVRAVTYVTDPVNLGFRLSMLYLLNHWL